MCILARRQSLEDGRRSRGIREDKVGRNGGRRKRTGCKMRVRVCTGHGGVQLQDSRNSTDNVYTYIAAHRVKLQGTVGNCRF